MLKGFSDLWYFGRLGGMVRALGLGMSIGRKTCLGVTRRRSPRNVRTSMHTDRFTHLVSLGWSSFATDAPFCLLSSIASGEGLAPVNLKFL